MSAYLSVVLLAVAAGCLGFAAAWRASELKLGWRFGALCLCAAAGGLVGGRAYILLEQWHNEIVSSGWLDGGFRLPGAVAGMLLGIVLGQRLFLRDVPLARIFDFGALAAQPALVTVRFGCLAAGCCFGMVTDLPWGMQFPRDSQAGVVHQALRLMGPGDLMTVPVHPLAVYFMLLHLSVGGVLLWVRRRQSYDGQLLLLCLMLGQGGKALLEGFRQQIPGAPTTHLVVSSAVIATIAGTIMLARAYRLRLGTSVLPGPSIS